MKDRRLVEILALVAGTLAQETMDCHASDQLEAAARELNLELKKPATEPKRKRAKSKRKGA